MLWGIKLWGWGSVVSSAPTIQACYSENVRWLNTNSPPSLEGIPYRQEKKWSKANDCSVQAVLWGGLFPALWLLSVEKLQKVVLKVFLPGSCQRWPPRVRATRILDRSREHQRPPPDLQLIGGRIYTHGGYEGYMESMWNSFVARWKVFH